MHNLSCRLGITMTRILKKDSQISLEIFPFMLYEKNTLLNVQKAGKYNINNI